MYEDIFDKYGKLFVILLLEYVWDFKQDVQRTITSYTRHRDIDRSLIFYIPICFTVLLTSSFKPGPSLQWNVQKMTKLNHFVLQFAAWYSISPNMMSFRHLKYVKNWGSSGWEDRRTSRTGGLMRRMTLPMGANCDRWSQKVYKTSTQLRPNYDVDMDYLFHWVIGMKSI